MLDRQPIRRSSRWTTTLAVCSLLSAILATSSVRGAEDPTARARALFLAGKKHYAAERYREAIAAFREANGLKPSPILDFNIARSHEELGEPASAIEHYERYLRARPKAANRSSVERRIAALRRSLTEKSKGAELADEPGGAAAGPPDEQPASSRPASQPGAGSDEAGATDKPPEPVTPYDDHDTALGGRASAVGPDEIPKGGPPAAGADDTGSRKVARAKASPPPRRSDPSDPIPEPRKERESGAFYKQWWFWTAVIGGVVIGGFVIGMAVTSGGSSSSSQSSSLHSGGFQLTF